MAESWDLGYLKHVVANRVDNDAIEDIIEDSINEVIQDIMSESQWHFMFGTVSLELTQGNEEVSPPSGIEEIHSIMDDDNDKILQAISEREYFDLFAPTPTEGTPEFYTYIEGDGKLRFHQVPDGVYNLTIFGILNHPILEEDSDPILIPRKYLSVLVQGVVALVKDFQDRPAAMNISLYREGIVKMKKTNNKLRARNGEMKDHFLDGRRRVKGPIFRTGGYNYR